MEKLAKSAASGSRPRSCKWCCCGDVWLLFLRARTARDPRCTLEHRLSHGQCARSLANLAFAVSASRSWVVHLALHFSPSSRSYICHLPARAGPQLVCSLCLCSPVLHACTVLFCGPERLPESACEHHRLSDLKFRLQNASRVDVDHDREPRVRQRRPFCKSERAAQDGS